MPYTIFRTGKKYSFVFLFILFLSLFYSPSFAQQKVKKVVLQAFWWNYWNNNFEASWANYLTELAPRLKQMGVDAVWIPPSYKNGGVNSVGYSPFDHYDLGDKYQKIDSSYLNKGRGTTTRVGTKDELLRMIAVMHANGIEVVQDMVLNHTDGAGAAGGAGGIDTENTYSLATNDGYKNFRYVSYATPVTDNLQADYWSRSGRWPKNYQNFHPHPNHNSTNEPMTQSYWGPDICYGKDCTINDGYYINDNCNVADGYGISSNVIGYNPPQSSGYMRNNARDWAVWLKKQTGVDGFRWDAVKHFDVHTQQDLSWNLRYGSGFANGGHGMINVGEYVGGKDELDRYTNHIYQANGGNNFMMGTFDFGLRAYNDGGIKAMTDDGGFYNMALLPGAQQNWRTTELEGTVYHRTMPFVNNHDTYRPQVDIAGNITGWNGGDELSPHIEPGNSRLPLAYAVILSMDGNPQLFFEDVFNIYSTGKRFSHLPTSTTDLPLNNAIQNLVWAHQVLGFKEGDYRVATASGNPSWEGGASANDLLVIERSGKALIGLNDRSDSWQKVWVNTDFPPGTQVKDYSGANGLDIQIVPEDGRIHANTPPVQPENGFYGYSIWAPVGYDNMVYTPTRSTVTVQEWEMADDLGDSHCHSLGYGGALPSNSTNQRVAGKIFVAAGQEVSYNIYPETDHTDITGMICDLNGNILATQSGNISAASPLTINYIPATDGWLVIKVRNTILNQPGQRVWCKVSYTAPEVINTRSAENSAATRVSIWTGNGGNTDVTDCRNWEEGRIPTSDTSVIIPAYSLPMPVFDMPLSMQDFVIENEAAITVNADVKVYGNFINNGGTISGSGKIIMKGNTAQTISGATEFGTLQIENENGVSLLNSIAIRNELILTEGHLILGDYNLEIIPNAIITGGSADSYIQTNNTASSGGTVCATVNNSHVIFPVGNTRYTPLVLNNTGTTMFFCVRSFDGVLTEGTSGTTIATNNYINKTWVIDPENETGANISATFQWNEEDESIGFNTGTASVVKNEGGGEWQNVAALNVQGSNPYTTTAVGITDFSKFAIVGPENALPVKWLSFQAKREEKNVLLEWAVEEEVNNKRYEVMRSINGTAYITVATVLPNTTKKYYWTDINAPSSKLFYKIKQIDLDDNYSFSKTATVSAGKESTQYKIEIAPNPVRGEVFLKTTAPIHTPINVQVYTGTGQLVATQYGTIDLLQTTLQQLFKDKAAGVYLIKFTLNNEVTTQKLLKQ